ncbi:putative aminoacrylate hydrolase RutD [Smittium mucronatum]|uniref:Putative aminoacrylate hydrolase RutD n=1 Tax=Smittium mucronatum TaxID=133383 RepID=A0A1R0GLX0_9FUNG|nr:putative aminoacrylate hydrolase RutD [Smittium mucronatum]
MYGDNPLNINYKNLKICERIKVGGSRNIPVEIYYELYGSGSKKVLFLNGKPQPIFRHHVIFIAKSPLSLYVSYLVQFPEYQIVVYDHRGTGYSESCNFPEITTSNMAKDAEELVSYLRWDKDVNIVGISMGGMIASELSLLIPEKISTITLCSTTSGRLFYKPQAVTTNLKCLMAKTQAELVGYIVDSLYPKEWLDSKCVFDSDEQTNRNFLTSSYERKLKNTKIHGLNPFAGQALAVLRHNVPSKSLNRMGELFNGKKIWIVVGTQDNYIPETDSEYLAKHIGDNACELQIFDGSGHAIPIQNFDVFSKKVHQLFGLGRVPE